MYKIAMLLIFRGCTSLNMTVTTCVIGIKRVNIDTNRVIIDNHLRDWTVLYFVSFQHPMCVR